LRDVYSYLQRLAVGLEQVVLDQMLYDGKFLEEFNEAEFKLKAVGERLKPLWIGFLTTLFLQVLCELQVAMLEKGIVMDSDESITRKVMSDDLRDIRDQTYRDLRDWNIYRDYMNSLEYVIHGFGHLRRRGPTRGFNG